VTNDKGEPNSRSRKGGKAGPAATVKFGSDSVPIYLPESKGRKRYFIAHHRDGKRIRKAFPDLAAANKEALFVAPRIQSGMQHVTDRSWERHLRLSGWWFVSWGSSSHFRAWELSWQMDQFLGIIPTVLEIYQTVFLLLIM
jgi:hypothetical protein